jgi:RES domain-containing protein
MTPPLWSASAVVGRLDFRPWAGPAWRAHRRKYAAADPGGSLRVSGRYNRGLDAFPPEQAFPALYLALGPEVCLGEVLRHITPDLLPFLNDYRLTELAVELTGVLDCRDPTALGIEPDRLCADTDYSITQDLAAAALDRRAEAILVPSATRLGDNLIVLPTSLRPESRLAVVGSRDPRLYVPR